jgi:ankyrin repeat protein
LRGLAIPGKHARDCKGLGRKIMTINTEFDCIHKLIKENDKSALVYKLDKGLDPNLCNKFGWTLLMIAVLHDRYEMANLLLTRGADPKRVNHFGDTANSLAKVKNFQYASA